MTQTWRDLRWTRATNPSPGGFAVTGIETDDGGFLFVPGQILMTEQARDFLPEITGNDDYDDITPRELAGLGLLLLSYGGPEPLPEKVDELQASAQAAAAALKAITHDDVIDPAACGVDLHYVFSGEGYLYHGGPATSPGPATPGWAYAVDWGQPGDPQLVVLDTGVAVESSLDVRGNVDTDADGDLDPLVPLGSNGSTLGAEAGHGTFIAALVARFSQGSVRIGVRQVLDADGYCTEVELVTALRELRLAHPVSPMHPCGVLNLSLGTYSCHDREPVGLRAELRRWRHRGAVIVAAAGNNGKAVRPFWPAAADGVVAVASVSIANGVAEASGFSNSGSWVDVATVGENIFGAYPFGDFAVDDTPTTVKLDGWVIWSGTSFAAPIIAAAVARHSVTNDLHPMVALDHILHAADQSGHVAPSRFTRVFDPGMDLTHP